MDRELVCAVWDAPTYTNVSCSFMGYFKVPLNKVIEHQQTDKWYSLSALPDTPAQNDKKGKPKKTPTNESKEDELCRNRPREILTCAALKPCIP